MGNLACDVPFRMPSQDYTFCLLIVRYMLSDNIEGKSALKARTFLHERDKVHVCYWFRLSMHLSTENQGRRRRSGRTASAGPLFWTSMLSAVSLFSRFGSFFFVLTSDFQFIDAIINNARCACHP